MKTHPDLTKERNFCDDQGLKILQAIRDNQTIAKADLSGVDLSGADLTGGRFEGVSPLWEPT